jgi:hypothetical protein
MGLHGLTQSELHRYKQSLLTEAAQTAAQYGQMDSETVLGMYGPVYTVCILSFLCYSTCFASVFMLIVSVGEFCVCFCFLLVVLLPVS